MDKKRRLLDVISPQTYDITLIPDIEKFVFTGEERIHFTLLHPTNTITLNAVALVVSKATIQEKEATISYNKKEMTVILTFGDVFQPGEYDVDLVFSGVISDQLKGWYRSAYTVDGQTRYMATTQFEEIGAREVFPCIDDPVAKAVFTFTFGIPKHLTAISNTVVEKIEEKEGLKYVHFSPTPKMSTYPLACIVGEFESIETTSKNGVQVRVFVTPGKKHLATFALSTASEMLTFYESYFDIRYPLPVIDLIAIPDFDAGAMENWGAITAREVALLIDEEKSSASNKQWVATVIAHELTHMWFGDLVTMEWWTYLWLNEGFASYMEYMAVNALFPEWNVWEQFAILDHNRALGLDSLKNTHPIETPVEDVERGKENFDEISYSKGASVIAMLAAFLGYDAFRDGLRVYLKKFSYGNAVSNDLWDCLEEVSGQPIRDMMQKFVQESGHPILSVGVQDNTLHLSQQRFFLTGAQKESSVVWKIPFALSASPEITEKYLMEEKEMELALPSEIDWVKVNTDESSFVRAVYSQEQYQKLQVPIEQKILSSIDRMGLIRDAFDGARAGILPISFALQLSQWYRNEDSYIVWATLSSKLSHIDTILSETKTSKPFKDFARILFSSIAKKVGWDKKATDTHTDVLLRSVVLYEAGKYGDEAVIAKARELFTQYLEKGVAIDNDIRGLVYALVAENTLPVGRQGGEKEWEIFRDRYIKEPLQQEKNRIGNALSSFKSAALIQKTLEFSQSEHVRSQDMGRFVVFACAEPEGKRLAWEFVTHNWDSIVEKFAGQHSLEWFIEGFASVVSKEMREEIAAFFASHPRVELARKMQQIIEEIDANISWLKRDGETLEKFLLSAGE